MTAQDIRELLLASPFRPFRLQLANGRSLRVPHPDFVLAGAELAAVASELPHGAPGKLVLVPYEQIVGVEILPRRSTRRA